MFKRIIMIGEAIDETGGGEVTLPPLRRSGGSCDEGVFLAPSASFFDADFGNPDCGEQELGGDFLGERRRGGGEETTRSGYERDLVESVWQFAETVPGTDSALWRRDEFGDWIYRLAYGKRASRFGWEIYDPGSGRHSQGVYAMRPMQWESYIRQFGVFT